MDRHLSASAIEKRKAMQKVMESCEKDLLKHVDDTSMPMWIIDKLKPLGVNGF